ncbi:MAG: hypothetical protein J6W75_08705 [Bacteroidaceae bacterium]|nr:hypothetical protein [Bacteroidaceae bacterium]
MKVKQLLTAALLFCSAGAWAQTDVTSTYLTNADFSASTAIESNLKGYGKDGSPYGFQAVDGWTTVITSGDNSNTTYPNSGMGGAVFAYGSSYQLQGNNKSAPATNPAGEASGNCLGFFAVWGCGGYYYQNVTFPAGKYTITVPMYNQSGTQANTTYTGFFPTSGTNRTVAVNPTVGQWVNQTVTFTLTAETAGQIRVGYQSTGSGSAANPHLFIDGVKIEYTAAVVKDVLENAITAATAANNVLNDADLAQAITAANMVLSNPSATQEQINAAAAALNSAIEVAMDGKDVTGLFVTNPGFESCTVSTDNAAAGGSAAPRDIAGGWTQNASAAWSSSAVVEYGGTGQVNGVSAPTADNLNNGGYTLGVSVGWGGTVTYKTDAVTLPAGVYNVTVNGYNALSGVTQFKSLFGFVPTEGTATMSTKSSFAYGAWEADQITFTLNEATEGYFQVGGQAISGGSGSNAKVFFDNITITYNSFIAGAQKAWQDAGKAAAAAIQANPNVTGAEKAALVAAVSVTPEATVDGYNAAANTINAATAALEAAAPAYNSIVALNARAEAAGIDAYAITATTTAAELTAAIPAFENSILVVEKADNVAAFNQAMSQYPYVIDLGDWTTSGAVKNEASQHWNGEATATYNEPNSWSSNTGGTSSWTQQVALPAGSYVLQIAGRHSSDSELTVTVKNGESELASASDFPAQGAGYGIDLDGNANFDMNGSYANTTGWGWEWRLLSFTLTEESSVTIAVNYNATVGQQWASFTSYVIRSQFPKEKIALLNAIKAAQAVDLTANVGTGAFQKSFVDDGTLATAITTAQGVYDDNNATADEVVDATSALNSVKASVVDAFENAELNAPAENDVYSLYLVDGLNKTVTFKAGNATAGTYAIGYTEDAGSAYNQAIHFSRLGGNNQYYLYIIDDQNVNHYLCTGTVYGGNDNQIRMTDDASNALAIEVIATAEDGVYNLKNTAANALIGSNGDVGFFTASTYKAFNINAAQKATVTINTTAAGWGTVILPFAAAVPEGLKAYTTAGAENSVLTLVEATTLEVNKPYILEGKVETTLEGFGLAKMDEYNDGLLVGVFKDKAAPKDDYVMQNQSGKVGFYQVDTDVFTPTVGAFHAYLTTGSYQAPEYNGVKVFYLGDVETGVQAVEVAGAENGVVYNLAGQRVNKAQKGIFIMNGKKVVLK